MKIHRARKERKKIVNAIITEQDLSPFKLAPNEETFYRARTSRALENLIDETTYFSAYYTLPTEKPFRIVIFGASAIIILAIAALVLIYTRSEGPQPYPLYAALASIAAFAAGWVITNGLSHRNAIRQKTNDLIFARFAQTAFGDALQLFHGKFGYVLTPAVTSDKVTALRESADERARATAAAVSYLLNYFEFIASGVLRGDLDERIVRENIKGVISFYYDKCEPHIDTLNRKNPKTYEHLRKLRASYRPI